jgi:hypothetical protein
MLKTEHRAEEYVLPSFQREKRESGPSDILEHVYAITVKPGENSLRIVSSRDFSLESSLEEIERIRKPLALRRIKGEALSKAENAFLRSMDSVLAMLLEPQEKEPEEVRYALEYAKKILKE